MIGDCKQKHAGHISFFVQGRISLNKSFAVHGCMLKRIHVSDRMITFDKTDCSSRPPISARGNDVVLFISSRPLHHNQRKYGT